jgi:hypothetical protein
MDDSTTQRAPGAPRYLRVSIARWNIDLHSAEAECIFRQIETDGLAVFRAQPGFVRYRLMRADGLPARNATFTSGVSHERASRPPWNSAHPR